VGGKLRLLELKAREGDKDGMTGHNGEWTTGSNTESYNSTSYSNGVQHFTTDHITRYLDNNLMAQQGTTL
jgi:hypothetical protein